MNSLIIVLSIYYMMATLFLTMFMSGRLVICSRKTGEILNNKTWLCILYSIIWILLAILLIYSYFKGNKEEM